MSIIRSLIIRINDTLVTRRLAKAAAAATTTADAVWWA